MNRSDYKRATNLTELELVMRREITEQSYFGEGQTAWTLTEVLKQDEREKAQALVLLNGSEINGANNGAPICESMKYKIRVLSRQACYADKDGKLINGLSPLDNNRKGIVYEINPLHSDPPIDGDVVRVKGNMRTKHPHTGEIIDSTEKRNSIVDQFGDGEDYHYKQYSVKDGCIEVPFRAAHVLLGRSGKALVFPQFRKLNSNLKDDEYKKQRKITNWLFEEVSPKPQTTTPNNSANKR